MSTRKCTGAVGAKGENVTKTTSSPITTNLQEKESIDALSVPDGADDTKATSTTTSTTPIKTIPTTVTPTTTTSTTTTTSSLTLTTNQLNATIKSEPDSPTQKMGNNASNNNRVTRNSPLPLIAPITKREQHGIDSEPTNSESEDNSSQTNSTKKPIRGRKSIKDNGKEPAKEAIKEDIACTTPTEEEGRRGEDFKMKNQTIMECNDNDKVSNDDNCRDIVETQTESEEIKEKDTQIKDLKESKSKDTKATSSKETKDKDSEEINDVKESTAEKESNGANNSKDTKDAKESNDIKDSKESKDAKVPKDTKESKDSKDAKTSKDTKESKEVVTNRLTRQAVISNTRMTRNRQASSGASTRPETPPVSARRNRIGGNARKTADVAGQKRKRSVEERSDTPVSKMIKLEPKDPDDEPALSETTVSSATIGNIDLEAVKIKQELIESDDASSTTAEGSNVSNVIATTGTNVPSASTTARVRASRWAGRKPTLTASPTTRSTRQSKVASPALKKSSISSVAQEPKRRRTGGSGSGSGVRRSASASLLKTDTQATGGNNLAAPDEDSKDSMASLLDDVPIRDVVKLENLTPELDDIDMESKKSNEDDEKMEEQSSTQLSNGVDEPLSIETEVISTPVDEVDEAKISKIVTKPIGSNAANVASTSKDASLSPELISEGVSEISVKQFYKRPQFLENNLGIEEDPKLGEIVQKVTVEFDEGTAASTKTDATFENVNADETISSGNVDVAETTVDKDVTAALNESFSAESMKEGELVYEESNDDGLKPPSNDVESSCVNALRSVSGTAEINEEILSNKIVLIETKIGDESLQEPLQLEEEEDGEDDDMTAEESETISMDNNPSMHDDAIEDDDDDQAEQALSKPINTIFEEIDELAQDGGLIVKIINDKTKETTSNVCDNEKAKLKKEEKFDANIKEEQKSNKKDGTKAVEIDKKVHHSKEAEQENSEKLGILAEKSKKIENELNIVEEKAKDTKLEDDEMLFAESKKEIIILEKTEDILKISETNIIKQPLLSSDEIEHMEVDETPKADLTHDASLKIKPNKVENPIILKEDIANASRPTTPKQEVPSPSTISAETFSPKKSASIKDEDNSSVKSLQSIDTNSLGGSATEQENDEERLRQKEQHLKNLGLLTHKAAEKRRLDIIQTAAAVEASRVAAAANNHHSKRNGGKTAAAASSATSHEYTGTLKTVIKLNRNSSGVSTGSTTTLTATTASTNNGSGAGGRKSHVTNAKDSGVRRQSLKITFQKGRGRATHHGSERNSCAYSSHGSAPTSHGEDSYYTIQNENEGAHKNSGGSSLAIATAGTKDQQLRIQKQQKNNNNNINNYKNYNNNIRNTSNVQTHGRKSYNSRSNTNYNYNHNHATHIDSSHSEGHTDSHQHHGGSHGQTVSAASHKKDDREEILIPEKASSFKFHPGRLCEDQCYYCSGKFGLYDTPCHVGQIKSVERQLKILKNEEKLTVDNCLCDACFRHVDRRANVPSYKKRLTASGHLETIKTTDAEDGTSVTAAGDEATATDVVRKCVVPDCPASAAHSLRRKCIRKSVKKFLLNFDMPTGSPYIWLCQTHYDAVVQCSGCVLCKRRLGKNHMYHITSDTERLEKALTDMGIPVQLGIGTAVCKLCRYFANLLMKPPDSTKSQKAEFVKNYRKRLLQFHNIHDVSNEVSDVDDDENAASTSKTAKRGRKEQHKASSPTASSSSSLVCVNENATDEPGIVGDICEQTSADNDKELMDFVEGETSNEQSKSPSPPGSAHQEESSKQSSRLKAILQSGGKTKNADLPSALLRSNPNLSMRELFPGEEDLGLHFKAPFGSSSSQRTPEGWTRVQTFLQYDEPTRRLWEELQKPYGNQSSFLRHLILLEKYYRNGDLVLSPNASSNASVYTQTVRQRLTSYDQGHCGGLDVSAPSSPPKAATPAKEHKAKEPESSIPLVEINDDDEDDAAESVDDAQKNPPDNDDDVVIQEAASISNSGEKNSAKRRSRSISVDKLTQQLSTNAVTIIARPKDTQQQQMPTTCSAKSSSEPHTPKRNDSTKFQASPSGSKSHINNTSPGIGSLVPLSSSALSISGTSIPGSIASSNSNNGNSRSILKSNLLGMAGNKSVEILPISSQKSSSSVVTATTVNIPTALSVDSNSTLSTSSGVASSKQQKILEVANKLLGSQLEAAAAATTKPQQQNPLLTSPPELVSLHRRSAGSSNNPPIPNTSISTSSVSASSTTASLINAKRAHLMPNRLAAKPPPNVVILPDTLNAHERAESKSWRPTLMSVEENQHLLNKNGPLYQTADGRRLPGLVQVQSGGKPFLISIFDYNRMCILRREKLLRDQMLKAGKHKSQHHQQQRNTGQQNANFNKMSSSSGGTANNNTNSNAVSAAKQAQAAAAQQQLLQLMQFHNRHQQHHHQQQQQQQHAAMKNTTAGSGRYMNIAPKPSLISTSSSMMPGSVNTNTNTMNSRIGGGGNQPPNFPMPLLANALTNAAAAAAANTSAANAAAASLNSTPWLWSNFPDAHELLRNGTGGSNKMPPLLPKPTTSAPATITSKQLQQQQQLLMDNNLMSKIPKSLTVIPQQKLMGSNNNASGLKE